jgi:hypothetical protein
MNFSSLLGGIHQVNSGEKMGSSGTYDAGSRRQAGHRKLQPKGFHDNTKREGNEAPLNINGQIIAQCE